MSLEILSGKEFASGSTKDCNQRLADVEFTKKLERYVPRNQKEVASRVLQYERDAFRIREEAYALIS